MAGQEQGYDAVVDAPFGRLGIRTDAHAVLAIDLVPDTMESRKPGNALAREVQRQLRAYFRDSSFRFRLPLQAAATPFQGRVRSALRRLRPGHEVSYGQLARKLATSPRSIGAACRANPVPIVIPCHRVVGQNGDGGYMGSTGGRALRMKRWLLLHETGK
jgi:methylated-DNA-[protein]-cysteine S-methyltransferase